MLESKVQNCIYESYLVDLGLLLQEKVKEWNKEKARKNNQLSDYDIGYEVGLHELISMMQSQANAFQIELSKIHMDKVDPTRDLFTYPLPKE